MPKNMGKPLSKRERSKQKHNLDFTEDFVSDIKSGSAFDDVLVGRVKKGYGFGRFAVLLQSGTETECSIRGNLLCRGGAARSASNPLAISANSFVIVQNAEFGKMIMGVLSRKQVNEIRDKLKATKSFFAEGEEGGDEEGYEFDYEEGEEAVRPAADRAPKGSAAAAAAGGDDEDFDIDGI